MTKISIISSNVNFKGGASIATKRLIDIFKKKFDVKIFFFQKIILYKNLNIILLDLS